VNNHELTNIGLNKSKTSVVKTLIAYNLIFM